MAEHTTETVSAVFTPDAETSWREIIYHLVNNYMYQLIVSIIALVILLKGFQILKASIEKNGIGNYNLQAVGVVILLPVILLLGAASAISGEVLSALLGAIAGYLFGAKKETAKST